MEFVNRYGKHKRVAIKPSGQSRTHQSFKADADVNNILSRYRKTGQLPELIQANPQYGDFSDVPSYQESLNRVIFAQEQFAALPSQVRARFANDPSQFLAFATDPQNAEELITMGLATRRVPEPESSVIEPPIEPEKVSKKESKKTKEPEVG